jgi:hypothetical protein
VSPPRSHTGDPALFQQETRDLGKSETLNPKSVNPKSVNPKLDILAHMPQTFTFFIVLKPRVE